MSIYSGFRQRKFENVYNKLIYKTLEIFTEYVVSNMDEGQSDTNQPFDKDLWSYKITKLNRAMAYLEKNKVQDPYMSKSFRPLAEQLLNHLKATRSQSMNRKSEGSYGGISTIHTIDSNFSNNELDQMLNNIPYKQQSAKNQTGNKSMVTQILKKEYLDKNNEQEPSSVNKSMVSNKTANTKNMKLSPRPLDQKGSQRLTPVHERGGKMLTSQRLTNSQQEKHSETENHREDRPLSKPSISKTMRNSMPRPLNRASNPDSNHQGSGNITYTKIDNSVNNTIVQFVQPDGMISDKQTGFQKYNSKKTDVKGQQKQQISNEWNIQNNNLNRTNQNNFQAQYGQNIRSRAQRYRQNQYGQTNVQPNFSRNVYAPKKSTGKPNGRQNTLNQSMQFQTRLTEFQDTNQYGRNQKTKSSQQPTKPKYTSMSPGRVTSNNKDILQSNNDKIKQKIRQYQDARQAGRIEQNNQMMLSFDTGIMHQSFSRTPKKAGEQLHLKHNKAVSNFQQQEHLAISSKARNPVLFESVDGALPLHSQKAPYPDALQVINSSSNLTRDPIMKANKTVYTYPKTATYNMNRNVQRVLQNINKKFKRNSVYPQPNKRQQDPYFIRKQLKSQDFTPLIFVQQGEDPHEANNEGQITAGNPYFYQQKVEVSPDTQEQDTNMKAEIMYQNYQPKSQKTIKK